MVSNKRVLYILCALVIITMLTVVISVVLSKHHNKNDDGLNESQSIADSELEETISNIIKEPTKVVKYEELEDGNIKYDLRLTNRNNNVLLHIMDKVDKHEDKTVHNISMNYCMDIVEGSRADRLAITRQDGIYAEYLEKAKNYRVIIRDTDSFQELAEYYRKVQDLYKFNCPSDSNLGGNYMEYVEIANEESNELGEEIYGKQKNIFVMIVSPFSYSTNSENTVDDILEHLKEQYDYYRNFKSEAV